MQRKIFWLAPLAICTLATGIAQAADGTANAKVITALTLISSTDLEFGQLSVGASGGSLVIATDDSRTQTGDVVLEGGTYNAGVWAVTGEASTAYDITLPASATLSSGGSSMTVDTFTSDKAGETSTLDGTGADTFKVGATLTVAGSQATGTYTGTYTVTVAYQ